MSEYVLTKDFDGEQERLALLETQADPLSMSAITAAGIGPGSRCLETLRTRILDAALLTSAQIDDAQRLLADPSFWDLGPAWIAAWGTRPA